MVECLMEKIGKLLGLVVMIMVIVFLFRDDKRHYHPSSEVNDFSNISFSSGFGVVSERQEDFSTFSNQLSTNPAVEEILLESDLSISEVSSTNIGFLKKVFSTTSDPQVMNMIIQLMTEEYQFLAAKQFIEQLSDEQRTYLDPLLHLQVLFNSFPLSSTTTFNSLSEVVQNYLHL
ncbi:MAG: hypothetical protein LBH96_04105 [Candidatus Peribacteria bacterium]|nr:hypothetical protein [Candidatus Peribacteria bacterium]